MSLSVTPREERLRQRNGGHVDQGRSSEGRSVYGRHRPRDALSKGRVIQGTRRPKDVSLKGRVVQWSYCPRDGTSKTFRSVTPRSGTLCHAMV
jgi:hypothetical protein